MLRSTMTKMLTTALSAGSLAAILIATNSGIQIAGIGGISPTTLKDVKEAIERGASAEDVAALGTAQGFDVAMSWVS